MITPIGIFFNRAPATLLSVEADDRSAGNTTSDGYLALNKLTGGQSDGYWLPPLAGHVASEFSKVHDRPVPNEIEEPVGSSILDEPLTYRLYLMACAVVGVLIGGGGYIYYRLKAKKGELQKNASTPPAEPKMYRVNGLKASSTATVERETRAPEKVIANLMMKEDRELGAKREELERAVTAAITEWFELPVEEMEKIIEEAPLDSVSFSELGEHGKKILYPWIKKRALKIHAENPITTPPRGAEAETTDVAIRETITFIKDFFNPQDAQDTALMTNTVSLAIDAVAEDAAREKTGLLAVLGEMAEFYGEFELAKKAYEALVRHEVLSKDEETKGRLLKSFNGASAPARFLLLGELARTKDHFSAEEFKDIIDTIISSETRFSSLRDIADAITNNMGTDAILQNAQREAGLRFSDTQDWSRKKWENSGLVAARLKDWRERIEKFETRIRDVREARLGRRK